jgi:alpha-mannosidase
VSHQACLGDGRFTVPKSTLTEGRLSLLRSATAPDPTQDVGRHDFSFAIMPHVGRFIESGTYHYALAFVNDVQGQLLLTPSARAWGAEIS